MIALFVWTFRGVMDAVILGFLVFCIIALLIWGFIGNLIDKIKEKFKNRN